MFKDNLWMPRKEKTVICSRTDAMEDIRKFLLDYNVTDLFGYNVGFDKRHLPELAHVRWYDIMKIAAYKQYNAKITDEDDCSKTGRLKRNYSEESMYRRLADEPDYHETHNALIDACDELFIMRMLEQPVDVYYDKCRISTSDSEAKSVNRRQSGSTSFPKPKPKSRMTPPNVSQAFPRQKPNEKIDLEKTKSNDERLGSVETLKESISQTVTEESKPDKSFDVENPTLVQEKLFTEKTETHNKVDTIQNSDNHHLPKQLPNNPPSEEEEWMHIIIIAIVIMTILICLVSC